MEVQENSGSSEDSLGSLTAGDVLIRSTSFHMKQTPFHCRTSGDTGSKPAACIQERIRISLKKLRELSPPCHPEDLPSSDEECIPPALPANNPSRSTTEGAAYTHAGRNLEQDTSDEKEVYSNEAAVALPSKVIRDGNKQKANDIFISQYDTGQKEAVRAVFKQRIQNAPVFKEVKVQLLDVSPDQKKSVKSTHSEMDSATTIAAATAAAIASTAPLLKVQNDLEAKVNSVSEMLSKLQETDKQLQRVAQRQASSKAQHLEQAPCHQRAGELEKQLNLFLEQRIQHLETLQQQQMNFQSHLINSALNSINVPPKMVKALAVTSERPFANLTAPRPWGLSCTVPVNPKTTSQHFGNRGGRRQKSPLKTPAPRRYAPVPVSKDAKISHKMAKREQPTRGKENILKSPYKEIQAMIGRNAVTLGGGRLLEQILNSQESPFGQNASPWKEPPTNSRMPWHSEKERSDTRQTKFSPVLNKPFQDTDPVESTVQRADDVLQDLGQLKKDMQDILQEAKEWKSDMNGSMKQKHQVLPRLTESQHPPKPSILQTAKAPKSILKDAEKILRVVRKNKKVLEENLEAIIRAKDGNALHSFIDALTANRDVLEEIRIRRTVDEWIKMISLEIQDEMENQAWEKDEPWKRFGLKGKKASREIKSQSHHPRGSIARKPLPAARPAVKPAHNVFPKTAVQNGYLSQIYGRPIYQGHRSTLKKSPYLRINSPPPKLKPPRPKLIESVRGTKVKSARTQTGTGTAASPKKARPRHAPCGELQYLFSPTKEVPDVSGPLEGHLIPMAVPLGKKQINISPEPEGLTIGKFHPVTVTASILPAPRKPEPNVPKPNIAVIEMKSEKRDPPKLTVQVLPNVDIDSVSSDSPAGIQHPSMSLPTMAVIQTSPGDSWHQEEEQKLPGSDFVEFANVTQDEEDRDGGEDEVPEFLEPVLEFNRHAETEPPQYNGPPFPPIAPVPQPSADILDEIIERRETLENKLVNWVEQEVMARVISGMYPPKKEAVTDFSSSESEESQAVSSDIVEAAGPAGFRLFVDAGVPVNSDMIRHFVSEALAEKVAVMLGDREGTPSNLTLVPPKAPVLETPLVTPQPTPPLSPLPLQELSPVRTPAPSPPVSGISGGIEPEAMAVSLVGTPVITPVATPHRVATPSPPVSEPVPDREGMESRQPPNPWGDAELPLEEEKPSPPSEERGYQPRGLIMSVAKEEEPENLVSPPPPEPVQFPGPLLQEPSIPSSPVHTLSSAPTTEESSLTLTETETTDRPISEGEVLVSYGQLQAIRALEGGLFLPNPSDSLTSTLQDACEMDYDPLSEGQVVFRPHKGHHHDPVLSLFSKLNQAPLDFQAEICHSEDTDNSAGELSEGQRPRLTKAAESILMGRSVYMDQPSKQQHRQAQLPGQSDRAAGDALEDAGVTHGPMSMAELEHPVSSTAQANNRLTSQMDDASQSRLLETVRARPVQPRVIQVRARSEITQQQAFQSDAEQMHIEPNSYLTSLLAEKGNTLQLTSLPAPAKMSVTVPSADLDDQQSFSSVLGSTDSSGADTF